MKKLLCLLLVSFLFSPLVFSRSLEEIKESGYINVGVTSLKNEKPMTYMENGKLVGTDVELITLIAKELDVEVRRTECVDLDDRLKILQDDRADIVVYTFSITEERKKKIDFSHAYLTTGIGVLMQNKYQDKVKTFDDLSGYKIGIEKGGSTSQEAFEKDYSNVPIQLMDMDSIRKKLFNGELDGHANDTLLFSSLIKEYPDKFYALKRTLAPDPYGVGVKKNNKELLHAVNKIIKNNLKDIKSIRKKHGDSLYTEKRKNKDKCAIENYVVKKSDTLLKIAGEKLNDKTRWGDIYSLNENIIPDANNIQIGLKLRINICSTSSDNELPVSLEDKLKRLNELSTEMLRVTKNILEEENKK